MRHLLPPLLVVLVCPALTGCLAAGEGRAPAAPRLAQESPPGTRTAFDDLETVGRDGGGYQEGEYLPPYELPDLDAVRWKPGAVALQGWFGAQIFETVRREGGSVPPVDGSDEDLSQLPTIGGGGQWKFLGNAVDIGFEGLLSFAGRASATAFRVGGGGAVVAVDVDLFLFDLFGGPFVNLFLGDRWRIYGAAGPLLQWAWYEEDDGTDNEEGSGFGTGYYARAGIELEVRPGLLVGIGARYSDSTVDLDRDLGDLDVEGMQYLLTITRGL